MKIKYRNSFLTATKGNFFIKCLVLGWLVTACGSLDDPVPVNEEELITTLTLTLEPQGGGTTVTLESLDLDGDGPSAPVITVSGDLAANTTYNGSIELLNESVNPAEDVTEEVREEGDEHQFFFEIFGGIDIMAAYADQDTNGYPVGLSIILTTGTAGSGSMIITLRHLPDKAATGVSDGDITNAAGETDLRQTFMITVS